METPKHLDIRTLSESSTLVQKFQVSRTKFDYLAISCKTGMPIVSSPSKSCLIEYLREHEKIEESDIIWDLQNNFQWPKGSHYTKAVEKFEDYFKNNISSTLIDSSGIVKIFDQLQINWIIRNFEKIEELVKLGKDL